MFRKAKPSAPEEKAAPLAAGLTPMMLTEVSSGSPFACNPVAYRCVRMIAEGAASVPLAVCEGGEVVTDGPLCRLLRRPNADQTLPDLLERSRRRRE